MAREREVLDRKGQQRESADCSGAIGIARPIGSVELGAPRLFLVDNTKTLNFKRGYLQ
jgi:hypothetical protein